MWLMENESPLGALVFVLWTSTCGGAGEGSGTMSPATFVNIPHSFRSIYTMLHFDCREIQPADERDVCPPSPGRGVVGEGEGDRRQAPPDTLLA